ncbi:MAG: PLP-dependent aminotransferase family protein [Chloroflexota bacterium]|nr:PLP-dependent aminotransferase family protein [Chloroflexota bacterium]
MAKKFDFEPLFSKDTPADARGAVKRGKYDFAVAYPDPESVPIDGLWQALRDAIQKEGKGMAIYPPPQGHIGMRELLVEKFTEDRGMTVAKEDIVLGNGSGQGITLLCQILVNQGDVVLTEDNVYVGTLRTLRRFKADVRGIPTDDNGIIPEELEALLKQLAAEGKTVKFIYTIPTFQNPMGSVLPLERRKQLLQIAYKYNVPIMEDDCYVDLAYEGDVPPAIHSLDDRGQVMYVGSVSKIIAPGVRLGWAVGPQSVVGRLLNVKLDGGANELAAMAINLYLRREMDSHISEICAILREKRDAMLSALGEYFPPSCKWTKPKGGLFIWLTLPEGVDASAFREKALDADVGYMPGVNFSPSGQAKNSLRLCFGFNTPDEIKEGIRRLAEVFEREGAFKQASGSAPSRKRSVR